MPDLSIGTTPRESSLPFSPSPPQARVGLEPYVGIALVITSCHRPDLLARTIQSMRPWVDLFAEKVVVEDSDGDFPLLAELRAAGWRVLLNGRQIGQHASIDRAYGTVVSQFIFHCEDDWVFSAQPDFLAAKHLLSQRIERIGKIGSVGFHASDFIFRHHDGPLGECALGNARYVYPYFTRSRTKYHHHSFNPSLLERSLWKRWGPWSSFRTEGSIARFLGKRGYIRIFQSPNPCHHIGGNRHVSDYTKRKTSLGVIRQWLKHGV